MTTANMKLQTANRPVKHDFSALLLIINAVMSFWNHRVDFQQQISFFKRSPFRCAKRICDKASQKVNVNLLESRCIFLFFFWPLWEQPMAACPRIHSSATHRIQVSSTDFITLFYEQAIKEEISIHWRISAMNPYQKCADFELIWLKVEAKFGNWPILLAINGTSKRRENAIG